MSEVHEQAMLDAPVPAVWALVGDPARYPEWLPRAMEVEGQTFEEGAEFVQVTQHPLMGRDEINFLIDHKDELRAIRMHCTISGMFADWRLTDAQGGTFVDASFGMEPIRTRDRVMDRAVGRRFFRRWLSEAVEGLREAATQQATAA
jgi:Polyketide cyclase / dehydrase and lipid transport